MSHLNPAFEPDIDSFLNLDQTPDYTPTSTSPNTQTVPSLAHRSSSVSSHFGGNSNTQTFAGPSFQYDAYRQQTGLPAGGLANTFAINQAAGLQHYDGHGNFILRPSDSINLPLTKVEDFDFNHNPYDVDMDYDNDSPSDLPTMFYPPGASSQSQFVSPTTLVSNASPASVTPVQRIYPGMHSQAAQVKAQQAQQKQQEIIRQQQMAQQQPRQVPGQKPLPKSQPAKDPQVEESITRILNEMRQKSVTSLAEDEDEHTVRSISNMPRTKKEEEDMDEDERLLASEEGKKLSSKERRQLRNKVSARAFRSRRKEYIGQLEGEVAAKADEASALRHENSQLREENKRLTDLTRMLLSSQAFSGFLHELSSSGLSENNESRQSQQPQQDRLQAQSTRKDVNPHEAARQLQSQMQKQQQQQQQQQQIGMALMPETPVDMSLFDTPSWNSATVNTGYQVFAVTRLPEGPALDLTSCVSKSSQIDGLAVSLSDGKSTAPSLLRPVEAPVVSQKQSVSTVEAVDSAPTAPEAPAANHTQSPAAPLGLKPLGFRLKADGNGCKSLDLMCNLMDDACDRLESFLHRD